MKMKRFTFFILMLAATVHTVFGQCEAKAQPYWTRQQQPTKKQEHSHHFWRDTARNAIIERILFLP